MPLIIFVSFLIFLEDRGPIIYKQKRSGKNRSVFNIYKLRTMKVDSEMNGVRWATKNDMRITFLGNYLRRCRIDELPQLINVIKGEMSLIGPRPERPEIDFELEKFIPEYNSRYQVSPGISGWAQVNYNYGASVEDSYNKFVMTISTFKINHLFWIF